MVGWLESTKQTVLVAANLEYKLKYYDLKKFT